MKRPTVDDYVQNGIYGEKQTKPDERRRFLGTIRERIVIALTTSQVRKEKIFVEVKDALKTNKKATLFLNGDLDYRHLSDYIKLANDAGVTYSMVTNLEQTTDIGLVLAYDYAIDKEEIFVKEQSSDDGNEEENDDGGFSLMNTFKQLFTPKDKV